MQLAELSIFPLDALIPPLQPLVRTSSVVVSLRAGLYLQQHDAGHFLHINFFSVPPCVPCAWPDACPGIEEPPALSELNLAYV
ncbi:hypothetical protein A0H81_01392 [Grifola frondosa]|uniref:Uncharacterized protein n=1 Tax=Grifola frondosa TaxID=5627 RepID=A0A1C7MQV1_GRIFR|nr:hypothetical protein A0H81_01392 [Grifola frondosa]